MKRIYLTSLLLLQASWLCAQSVYAPLNQDYYHIVDRYEIKSGRVADGFHSSWKPYERKSIVGLVDRVEADSLLPLSSRDRFNLQYLRDDSHEWNEKENSDSKRPVLRHFYKKKPDFYHFRNEDLNLHINPVLYLQMGNERGADAMRYINTRGVEVRGMINEKVGFYTFMSENQALFPGYVQEMTTYQGAVPGEGFWKRFKTNGGVDFFNARGYITVNPTKNIGLQFGHDRQFIGNGIRSLILSDYAPNYLFLKASTRVWKFNYTNLFTQMTGDVNNAGSGSRGNVEFERKFMAMHHLSLNITKNLNIGIFETVVFARNNDQGQGSFDINYLNPIIFYRSVEQQLGSPDNALLGLDAKWNLFRHVQLYGQFALDEFLLSEITARDGWWGNKHAIQAGFKYIDVLGIPNLDIQGEYNVARPFMYTHADNSTSYTHYQQPLAHPRGANFKEFIGIMRYQPLPRLTLTARAMHMQYGEDSNGSNWGTNPTLSYITRGPGGARQERGHFIGQGIATTVISGDFTASYQLRHNLFLDLTQVARNKESELAERSSRTIFTSAAIRWNIAQRTHNF
jgi:hypothetical protein